MLKKIFFKQILILFSVMMIVSSFNFGDVYNCGSVIANRVVVDINHDGKKDIGIICQKDDRLALKFYIYHNGTYDRIKSYNFTDVSMFTKADLNGTGENSLVIIKNGVVYNLEYKSTYQEFRSFEMFRIKGLFAWHLKKSCVNYPFCKDLNGDGLADIVFPVYEGFEIVFQKKGNVFKNRQTFPYKISASAFSLAGQNASFSTKTMNYSFTVPELETVDYNQDGNPDIFIAKKDRVDIFLCRQNRISSKPLIFRFPDVEKDETDGGRDGMFPRLITAVNFNNDKYLDFAEKLQVQTGEFAKVVTSLRFYEGSGSAKNYQQPDYAITAEGLLGLFPPIVKDINGDGYMDIQDFLIPITMGKIISAALSKSTKAEIRSYIYSPSEGFIYEDDNTRTMKINMKFEYPFIVSILNMKGDFDGDGVLDLMAGDLKSGQLELFRGDGKGRYSEDPFKVINQQLFLNLHIEDMNQNGRDDIIMFDEARGDFSVIIL